MTGENINDEATASYMNSVNCASYSSYASLASYRYYLDTPNLCKQTKATVVH